MKTLHGHPCCRIPALPLDAPAVLCEQGNLRPERAILYNRPFLLLHHYSGGRSAADFPLREAELAGLSKTATRLWALLGRLEATADFLPLWWETPEVVGFALRGQHDPVVAATTAQRWLVQAERLEARTLSGEMVLEFRRC